MDLDCVKKSYSRSESLWWPFKCVTAPKEFAHLVALLSAQLRPKLNIQVSVHCYQDIFDFLKAPIFWKILKWPWSHQKWTCVKMARICPKICLKHPAESPVNSSICEESSKFCHNDSQWAASFSFSFSVELWWISTNIRVIWNLSLILPT